MTIMICFVLNFC